MGELWFEYTQGRLRFEYAPLVGDLDLGHFDQNSARNAVASAAGCIDASALPVSELLTFMTAAESVDAAGELYPQLRAMGGEDLAVLIDRTATLINCLHMHSQRFDARLGAVNSVHRVDEAAQAWKRLQPSLHNPIPKYAVLREVAPPTYSKLISTLEALVKCREIRFEILRPDSLEMLRETLGADLGSSAYHIDAALDKRHAVEQRAKALIKPEADEFLRFLSTYEGGPMDAPQLAIILDRDKVAERRRRVLGEGHLVDIVECEVHVQAFKESIAERTPGECAELHAKLALMRQALCEQCPLDDVPASNFKLLAKMLQERATSQ
jgi:hypothetical protein